MGLRTADDYLASLNDGREVYYDGERVQDIVGHPVLGQSARHFARVFTLQADPRFQDLATVEEDGERVSRFFTPPRSGEELQQLSKLVEAFAIEAQGADFHLAKFTAANALRALMRVGKRIDQEHGTSYGERAATILAACRHQDLTGALCMSDTKGDRTNKPHDQADPDLCTRIVERRPDGVVMRGAKTSVTGSPFVDEQIVMPTKNMPEAEAEYAVACAVPTNAPGVKIIASHGIQPPTSHFDSPLGARYLPLHPKVRVPYCIRLVAVGSGNTRSEQEGHMAYTDTQGYLVSTSSSSALAAYEQGTNLWIRWRGGAMEALDSAIADDPQFALAHCARAYLGWRMGRGDIVVEAHQHVMALADDVHDPREHLHTQVVDAIHQHDNATTLQRLEALVEAYPTDHVATQVLSFVYSARGDKQRSLTQARRSLAASPDDPHFLTMTAFYLEQSNTDADEGLELGLRALAADPGNLYTYHAVGHNYQQRGDYAQCLATFERANSIERYPHLLWHLAEAHAILGDTRLTRDYWASTAPALPLFERIELQWRLEMLRGAPVDSSIWQDLATQGEQLLEQAEYLTIWMHHWIGLALARAGDVTKAEQQVARLRQLPEGRPGGYWSTVGAALLEGEIALIRDELATAVQLMTPAIEQMHDLGGGSREQKDIFMDVFLEVQWRLGNTDAVIELAQRRLERNPNHFQSLAALAWAYRHTGQTSRQHQTYQTLINRAEAAPVDAGMPALLEARQALYPEA